LGVQGDAAELPVRIELPMKKDRSASSSTFTKDNAVSNSDEVKAERVSETPNHSLCSRALQNHIRHLTVLSAF
jgi:hypothetical protein